MDTFIFKSLDQSFCGERLLAKIVEELKYLSNKYRDDDFVKAAYELGVKLLTYDYYDEYNSRLNSCSDFNVLISDELEELRIKAFDKKHSDYDLFFKLLSDHLEEWC